MKSQIQIPLACPECGEKMVAIRYDAPLQVLSNPGWHVCTSCRYEQRLDEFKKSLFTV